MDSKVDALRFFDGRDAFLATMKEGLRRQFENQRFALEPDTKRHIEERLNAPADLTPDEIRGMCFALCVALNDIILPKLDGVDLKALLSDLWEDGYGVLAASGDDPSQMDPALAIQVLLITKALDEIEEFDTSAMPC